MSKRFGREVSTIETWVRRGIAEGWCKPVPSHDQPGRFRRRFAADLSMNCEDPPTFEVWGRYDRRERQVRAIFVDIKSRCRKCETCLKNKARLWTARAFDEYAQSQATWLLTLTLRPEEHYRMDARTQQPLFRGRTMVRDKVGPLSGLAPATLFRLRAREVGYDITDMLKRIRKNIGPFRYLLVAERHMKDPNSEVFGKPHFHLLIHEKYGSPALCRPDEWQTFDGPCESNLPCLTPSGRRVWHKAGTVHDHARVRQSWKLGFTNCVACLNVQSAVYVCKYVSKDPMARVRASIGYGKSHEAGVGALGATLEETLEPSNGGLDKAAKLDTMQNLTPSNLALQGE